jgi:Bacteriophage related domain of unknown function
MAEILNIKKATERRLNAITPTVPTGYEGVEFTPPVNAMYQRCQLVFNQVLDPSFPIGYHREEVQLQVFVCDIKGKGTGTAIARAELLRSNFHKGLSLTEGNTSVRVLSTPKIGSAFIAQDRIIIPVIVDLTCEVNT